MSSCALLTAEHGHLTIGWDANNTDVLQQVTEFVSKKMLEGYVFLVLEGKRKVLLESTDQLRQYNNVIIQDKDLQTLVKSGAATIVNETVTAYGELGPSEEVIVSGKRATTADEVAAADTIAVRAPKGG